MISAENANKQHRHCSSSGGLRQLIAPEDMLCDKLNRNTLCCHKKNSSIFTMGTWNVRSLHQMGKLENVMQEMSRMNIDILGTVETFWEGTGDFEATLPETEE